MGIKNRNMKKLYSKNGYDLGSKETFLITEIPSNSILSFYAQEIRTRLFTVA